MALFNFKKKSNPAPCCDDTCCGDGCCASGDTAESTVKVLGGGCKKCHALQENTQEALQSLGMDTQVELITDPAEIAAYGVLSTPALAVDGKVLSTGRVLTREQAAEAIKAARS